MQNIRILPVHLVNKIAAGEVIERPASIVKELVENALDAGATRVEVAVEDGGKKRITVTDDGSGMAAEDLALAFVPHATSKLGDEDDLFRIHTMGFRGEALASIASVSHAHIRTCRRSEQADDVAGYEVEASGESAGQVRPCAAAFGASVTVRDLFFNTPARRKFLRSANTELGHISEQIARLALPHPMVAFLLTHNGRTVYNLPAVESTAARAGDLFGPEVAKGLIPLRARGGSIQVNGLAGPPATARSSPRWQYFFLNGRYVRDRLLGHALREAYRGRLDPSRYPVALLFLQIDPAEVDVNVHPTKIEVRFRDPQAVYGEVLATLRETLSGSNLTARAELTVAQPAEIEAPDSPQDEQRRASLRQALADFFKSVPPAQPRLSFPEHTPIRRDSAQGGQGADPAAGSAMFPATTPATPPGQPPTVPGTFSPLDATRGPADERTAPSPGSEPAEAENGFPQPPLAEELAAGQAFQVHSTYIVAAAEDGLIIVDQHALHERLIYNDLKRRLAEGNLESQRLLIPEVLKVTPGEASLLQQCGELLGRLGVETAPFGPDTVAVQQFPLLLIQRGLGIAPFLRELLDRLGEEEGIEPERLLESVLDVMACKAAVKAGDPLTPGEIRSLLARAEEADKGAACPHGRPTTLRLTLRDLQKQFKRI
ncbi:MAG: DNA mismatch repair protein MutL [Planctomycetes bacterium ADurb.Bin126]|nr:MAG: DNA mismatch repair protein MutL [Planctomycetes bacterium ADurb.Bin126]HQL72601.1 DNA mismatch repair endonuclease MutL [Phycisphaerae bacterium]